MSKCIFCESDKATCYPTGMSYIETVVNSQFYCTECKKQWNTQCLIFKNKEIPLDEPYRLYKTAELKLMKTGTCFMHQRLGKCILMRDPDNKPYMIFKSKLPNCSINTDGYPWSFPMRLLS